MGRNGHAVFTQSLLDTACAPGTRRWPKLLSFALQAVGAGLLILAPLFQTYAVPALVEISSVLAPPVGAPPRPATPQPSRDNRVRTSEIAGDTVIAPVRIPKRATVINDESLPSGRPGQDAYVPGAIPGADQRNSAISDLVAHVIAIPPRPAPAARTRLSEGVSQGYLAQRVQPVYPIPAIAARIQGSVVLMAVISRSGEIENLRVVSGHPMLAPAALQAVRQWRYQPYRLNGEAVEVETKITVNFVLAQ